MRHFRACETLAFPVVARVPPQNRRRLTPSIPCMNMNRKSFISKAFAAAGAFALLIAAVRAQQIPNYSCSWVGNTFGGANNQWIAMSVQGLFVGGDGKVYANANWDENGRELGIYQNGGLASTVSGSMHGWGRAGGSAIVATGSFIYLTMNQNGDDGANTNLNSNGKRQYPDPNNIWYSVRRYDLSGNPSNWGQNGIDGSMLVVNSGTRTGSGMPYSGSKLTGLSVIGTELLVSDPTSGTVKVYDVSTTALKRSFTVPRPGPECADATGNLWVLDQGDGSNAPKVRGYTTGGTLLSGSVAFATGVAPSSVAYDNFSGANRLFVTDAGADNNVKIYNLTGLNTQITTPSATFGVTKGIFAGSGATIGTAGNLRFFGLSGAGVDSSGNIYVCNTIQNGGVAIESYKRDGSARNWVAYGLTFVDMLDVDPANQGDGFTKNVHFGFNYLNPLGQEWSFKGITYNPLKYPTDPRNFTGSVHRYCSEVRRFAGAKFLVIDQQIIDSTGAGVQFLRFNSATDGEVAIPSTKYQKQENGWGMWVDRDGNVWECGTNLYKTTRTGLDASGNPVFSAAVSSAMVVPGGGAGTFNKAQRVLYDADSDTLYVAGFTTNYPNSDNSWGRLGTVISKYANWSGGNRTANWTIVLPSLGLYDSANNIVSKSMDVAGSYFFMAEATRQQIHVFRVSDGSYVGYFLQNANIGGSSYISWIDFPQGIRAFKRSSGEYIIFREEDGRAKVEVFRWIPPFETENLVMAAKKTTDTHRIIADPAFSNGEGTILDAVAVNDFVTYTVPGVEARTYDIRIGVKNFNSRGIAQFATAASTNGSYANHGAPQDLYSPDALFTELDLGPVQFGSNSDKAFRFTVTGKNPSGTGYSMCFDYIQLVPQ